MAVDACPRWVSLTVQICSADAIEEKLPLIEVLTLIVRGSRDSMVPQAWAEEVTALLPQGQLAIMPGAGHAINYSAPLELA
jgi:pimeloyl-ACP methyl ester carboxylesterase